MTRNHVVRLGLITLNFDYFKVAEIITEIIEMYSF